MSWNSSLESPPYAVFVVLICISGESSILSLLSNSFEFLVSDLILILEYNVPNAKSFDF